MKGGKREGAGRPRKEPTKYVQVRVPSDRFDELAPKLHAYAKKLIKSN